jgi:protein-S-isoprenylcysteine O-methyltransferase Ste14
MALREEFARDGLWLFRWRGMLPLGALGLILAVIVLNPAAQPSWAHGVAWQAACVSVSLFGLAVRVWTVGRVPEDTSRRSTRERQASSLNRTGPYSVVRHPLYLGNFGMWLGLTMAPGVWWLAAIVSLAYALYYERIMFAEEQFLHERFGQEYLDWTAQTPAIIPDFRRWQPADLPFSWRTVLRREYASAFALVVAFTLLGVATDSAAQHALVFDRTRMIVFGVGLAVYLLLRGLKRGTRLLHVEGR